VSECQSFHSLPCYEPSTAKNLKLKILSACQAVQFVRCRIQQSSFALVCQDARFRATHIARQLIGAAVTACTLCQTLDRIMPRELLHVAASTLGDGHDSRLTSNLKSFRWREHHQGQCYYTATLGMIDFRRKPQLKKKTGRE
jgi:hypothetical protein